MIISLVQVHVKPEFVQQFIEITRYNAENSAMESGVARFDFLQQVEDPTRFTLVEVFRDADAPARHRETEHYQRWRETVQDWMAEPRQAIRHVNVFPGDDGWE